MLKQSYIFRFGREVTDGEIGTMEDQVFYSCGKYYSKISGEEMSRQDLIKLDKIRLKKLENALGGFFYSKATKKMMKKEYDLLKVICALGENPDMDSYEYLRREMYYALNASRLAKKHNQAFVYHKQCFNPNNWRMILTRSKELDLYSIRVVTGETTDEQYLKNFGGISEIIASTTELEEQAER